MRKILLFLFTLLIISCGTTKYIEVPVDNVRIEYRNIERIDTFIKNDSIIIRDKGDTVFIEKYKYLYKIREVKDTVNCTDTITKIKTVEVTKEVNRIYNWQVILMVLGGVSIALGGYKLIKLIKV